MTPLVSAIKRRMDAIELSSGEPDGSKDARRMQEMNRPPVERALRREITHNAVSGLVSTVTSTWQNQFFLAPIALATGGRAGFFWASIVVFLAMYVVYVGLNEKAERWPASGGQYYWVAQLAPSRYKKILSFFSGWMLVSSWQIFLSAGVMIVGNGGAALVVLHTGSNYFWLPTVLSIVTAISVFAVNRWAQQTLAKLEFLMLMYQVTMFLVLTIVLLLLRQRSGLPYASATDVFFTFGNAGGWATVGGAVVLTTYVPYSSAIGYDCAFHMGEEIKDASLVMPIALRWAVRLMLTLGLAVCLAVNFSIPDINAVFDTSLSRSGPIGPAVQIVHNATESLVCTTIIMTLVLVSMLPSCANAFTAASRQLWAFADDGGLPGSWWIRVVLNGQPTKALWLTLIGPVIFPLLNLGSPVALNAIISLVINNLIASYLIVAATSLHARYTRRRLYEISDQYCAKFRLGHAQGLAVDAFTIIALLAGFIVALFPPLAHPTLVQMNWASVLFCGFSLGGGLLYYLHGRQNYKCPHDAAIEQADM